MLSDIGVHYYQGYFFHKPEIQSGYFVEPIKLNLLQLFTEIYQPFIEFDAVSRIISQDVGLINGVLKMVNLDSERNRVEITSVKQAVTFLGADKIKQYIAIIAMTKLASDCVNELLIEALIRAKMMELLSMYKPFLTVAKFAFITGLLSNVSAILRCSLPEILLKLPLAKEIKTAILERNGLLYEMLEITKHFENSLGDSVSQELIIKYEINELTLLEDYNNSLKWCFTICP